MIMYNKTFPQKDLESQRWIRWMDGEVFPDDKPVTFALGTEWFFGSENGEPFCYAAWRPHYRMHTLAELHWNKPDGFLYRAGVLVSGRGRGCQKELIKLREEDMKSKGITRSITYTDPISSASMKSLIACGYKPYTPILETNLAGLGRGDKFVHWEKAL